MKKLTLDTLREDIKFFNKMYDEVRIVDPLNKRVLEYQEGQIKHKKNSICYNYWITSNICENCISFRAHKEDKSFMKLEQSPDTIMMVTAIPIDGEQPVVLEFLKDATDSMMVGIGDYNEGNMMVDMISRMNDLVVKDPLTSVYNRRFIDERLPVDIVKATIGEQPLSMIFIDVDNLKNINDEYGHQIGDLVLQQIGKTIKKCIRFDEDWVARYGGDEFVVCLNNTSNKVAHSVASRIQEKIKKISKNIKQKDIELGVSMGIHTMEGTKLTPDELIKYADNKMYTGKQKGKDTIIGDYTLKFD